MRSKSSAGAPRAQSVSRGLQGLLFLMGEPQVRQGEASEVMLMFWLTTIFLRVEFPNSLFWDFFSGRPSSLHLQIRGTDELTPQAVQILLTLTLNDATPTPIYN